jgi:hypothetical protein
MCDRDARNFFQSGRFELVRKKFAPTPKLAVGAVEWFEKVSAFQVSVPRRRTQIRKTQGPAATATFFFLRLWCADSCSEKPVMIRGD